MDSCGGPAEMRRRSEEKLRGGEAFDNLHGSAAKRTSRRTFSLRCELLVHGCLDKTNPYLRVIILSAVRPAWAASLLWRYFHVS